MKKKETNNKKVNDVKKKKHIFIKILLVILVIVIVGFVGFKVMKEVSINNEFKDMVQEAKENGETHVFIEINPKMVLTIDKDNNVIEISPANVDAFVITDHDFSNLDLESAINKIITIAKENNYLTDKKEITVISLTEDNGCIDKIKQYVINNDKDIKVIENDKNAKDVYKDMQEDIKAVIEENVRRMTEITEEDIEKSKEARRPQYIEEIKEKETTYLKELKNLLDQGYVYDKEASLAAYDGANYYCKNHEELNEYGFVDKWTTCEDLFIPSCSAYYLTEEECKTYCSHCKYDRGQ